MNKETIYKQLEPKNRNLDQIANKVVNDIEIIDYLIDGLSAGNARVKYGSLNILVIISKEHPKFLYPHFELFIQQLDHKDKFIKWGATNIIANLTNVDNENKFDAIFDFYFSEITGPIMITAANITKGAAIIAKAKPYLTERITNELLKIKNAKYQTDECHNIALGHMISSFDKFFKQVKNRTEVIDLVKEQINNPRKPTKNKAERFIKKWEKVV